MVLIVDWTFVLVALCLITRRTHIDPEWFSFLLVFCGCLSAANLIVHYLSIFNIK